MEKWQYDLLASKYGHENIKFSANKSHITGEGKTLKAQSAIKIIKNIEEV